MLTILTSLVSVLRALLPRYGAPLRTESGRPTATASPRSLEATRRVPHPGRRQTVGQGAVGPADDRETLSTQKSQPCPGRLHRVRRPFRGGEGHLLCTRLCLQPYIRNWSATITSIAWQF